MSLNCLWACSAAFSNRNYDIILDYDYHNQPFLLLSYFPWWCAWGGCAIICRWFHLYPGKLGFVSLSLNCRMMCTDNYSTLRPDARFYLFAHCSISLSSSRTRICRYWTFEMLVRYILSSVCLRFTHWSQMTHICASKLGHHRSR